MAATLLALRCLAGAIAGAVCAIVPTCDKYWTRVNAMLSSEEPDRPLSLTGQRAYFEEIFLPANARTWPCASRTSGNI
jgi:hypothetical protein